VPVFLDGAQADAAHGGRRARARLRLLCLFGHKMWRATGIGVLYGKLKLLEALPPYQGGGDMIKSVTFEKTIYNDLPWRFEAGTANIAGAPARAAVDYLESVAWPPSRPMNMSCCCTPRKAPGAARAEDHRHAREKAA